MIGYVGRTFAWLLGIAVSPWLPFGIGSALLIAFIGGGSPVQHFGWLLIAIACFEIGRARRIAELDAARRDLRAEQQRTAFLLQSRDLVEAERQSARAQLRGIN